jgi:hypothetical protein
MFMLPGDNPRRPLGGDTALHPLVKAGAALLCSVLFLLLILLTGTHSDTGSDALTRNPLPSPSTAGI